MDCLASAAALVPTSSVLGGLVIGLSLLRTVLPALDEALALVPHHTVFSPVAVWPVPFCWNVVTAHLLEDSWLKALLLAPWLVILGRMLERLWTARAFVLHLLFTAACSGSVVFLAELVHVYRTHHDREFFLPIRGCVGVLVALAVGLRHACPLEALPPLPRSWGVQCQHLPFWLALAVAVAGLVAPRDTMVEWPFAPLSLFFGWLHIRYVMWFPYAAAHGDHSQDFCFVALFPRQLSPVVGCLGSVIYSIGALIAPGYIKLREAEVEGVGSIVYDPRVEQLSQPPGPSLGAPSGAPGTEEYNARRAKALELLDRNLNSLLAGESGRPVSLGIAPLNHETVPRPVVGNGEERDVEMAGYKDL